MSINFLSPTQSASFGRAEIPASLDDIRLTLRNLQIGVSTVKKFSSALLRTAYQS